MKPKTFLFLLIDILLIFLWLLVAGTVICLFVKHVFAVDVTEEVATSILYTLFFASGYTLRGAIENKTKEAKEE